MNNKKKYKVEDFVLDPRFRKWILDPDEVDDLYWEEWLRKYPHHVPKISEARSIISKLPQVDYQFNKKDKHNLWQSILAESKEEGKSERKRSEKVIPLYNTKQIKQEKKSPVEIFTIYWRVAAAILVLMVFSFLVWDKITLEKEHLAVEKIVKKNPMGQKSTIFLGDGSEVILNSDSEITYNNDFGRTNRVIHLEGEAFFKVVKNENQPFIVISNGLTTTALGTSFNVKSFKGTTKVALVEGKVLVEKKKDNEENTDSLMLMPGEQAVFSGKSTALVKGTFELKKETAWKDGIIFFKDADEEEVFTFLEKWYGVKISEINNSAKNWNYSGEFKNMSLQSVLMSIGFTMNFEFSIEGNHIKIKYLKY